MSACNSCQIMNINGFRCHELGCPDSWRDRQIECKWCGCEFQPESMRDIVCSHSCGIAYAGVSCECEECCQWLEVDAEEITA